MQAVLDAFAETISDDDHAVFVGQTVHWGLLKEPWIAGSLALTGLGGSGMLGRKERDQLELVVAGSLRDILPEDHVLVRVDSVFDLRWLRGEVADHDCLDNGRPGIDPEVAVRLMLAGFLHGIVQDRRLMRGEARPATGSRGEAERVNLAIRWFIGYGLHEALPDHSSLTRIRQRWDEAGSGGRPVEGRPAECDVPADLHPRGAPVSGFERRARDPVDRSQRGTGWSRRRPCTWMPA